MSVYVDPLMNHGWKLGPSCHLYADRLRELHEFAASIGLKRVWFQEHPRLPHYDLTAGKRAQAVAKGAREVGREHVVEQMRKNVKTLFIIDAHSQIYRAHYAPFAELTAPDGEPTKATYQFMQMLFKLIRLHHPQYLAVTFDSPRALLRRREWDPAYKSGRHATPPEVIIQAKRIRQLLRRLGVAYFRQAGFEADDLIATAARWAHKQPGTWQVVIVSRDKDLMQLVNPQVRLYDPQREEFLGVAEVEAKWGVWPKQLPLVLSLMGDKTDGIEGVRGLGPKTAAKIVRRYPEWRLLWHGIDDFLPRHGWVRHLQAAKQSGRLELNYKLVQLEKHIPMGLTRSLLRLRKLDMAGARPIFQRLGFRRWAHSTEE